LPAQPGRVRNFFSKALSAADYTVFDGDKHMTGLSKKFSELGSEAIWKYIDEEIFANRIKFEDVVVYR
jgi:hypothetical protein